MRIVLSFGDHSVSLKSYRFQTVTEIKIISTSIKIKLFFKDTKKKNELVLVLNIE